MEEILASIKRVIAEDGRAAAVPLVRKSAAAESAPADEDVLELDDPVSDENGLVSEGAAAASREKLAALSALRPKNEGPIENGALEALVRDMLRPMLKDWLDRHLPEMVEELVTREIARITGRNF